MTNYRTTPAGESSPTVTFYGDSMNNLPRQQATNVERHDAIAGSNPGADQAGLEPGQIRFEGYWFGANAEDIATTFRDGFLDDPAVERVDVEARDGGQFASSPFNGTYQIAEESRVDQVDPQSRRNWQYRIVLIED